MKHLNFVFLATGLLSIAPMLHAQLTLNPLPSRVVGQPRGNDPNARPNIISPLSQAPNAVVGREFNLPAAVALDATATPPILYVADYNNNRVLAWRNPVSANNGAPADLVIGQRDFITTVPQGPGQALSTGLYGPNGLAVDAGGNLYVADAGNNRILRYPRPFEQPAGLVLPDFVIGQPNFTTRAQLPCSEKNLNILPQGISSAPYNTGITLDRDGNLWLSDWANHRVLRFPASSLAAGQSSNPAADLVLGQANFTVAVGLPASIQNRSIKQMTTVGTNAVALLNAPSGLAFDSGGRLYVADALSRVLVFAPPFASGIGAARVMGISSAATPVNESTLFNPQFITMFGNSPLVVDIAAHRILRYDPFDQWPAETPTVLSPPAKAVIGQADFTSSTANRGQRDASEVTLSGPVAAAATSNELYVADTFNHRVLVFPAQSGSFTGATKVLGQDGYGFNAPNLAEGRELYVFGGYDTGSSPYPMGSAAVDRTKNPPALYIADTYNNRILGYRDARKVKPGDKADLVIGQGDTEARFFRTSANYGSTSVTQMNDSGLSLPTAVAVDANGNLYVADFGNSRVLRFPAPFAQPDITVPLRANLVLGQTSFTGPKNTDASQRTMSGPHGLAFTLEGHLLVSDARLNRILLFRKDAGDFTNGMSATAVIGQPDFFSSNAGSDTNRFTWPRGIATDTADRLYVVDTAPYWSPFNGSRILVFDQAANPGPDPRASLVIANAEDANTRLNRPHSIYVSPATGEIWVAETERNRILRYADYDTLNRTGAFSNSSIPAFRPISAVLDSVGSLYVTEAIHRVSVFFPTMAPVNAANYFPLSVRAISPGQYVVLYPPNSALRFSDKTQQFDTVPMPTVLADTQVLVNDIPAPVFYVSPGQINFLTPMSLPTTGTGTITVIRPSTGDIVAEANNVPLGVAAPGLIAANGSGSGQLAALNEDNTLNDAAHPVARGHIIQLFGTGQGFVPGAPPDGAVPGGVANASTSLRVFFDAAEATDIQYHGLAPSLIGTWQINVRIPEAVAPGNAVKVVVVVNNISSFDGNFPDRRGTIAVKQ